MAVIKRSDEVVKLMDEVNQLSNEKDYAGALAKCSEIIKLMPNDDDTYRWFNGEYHAPYARRGGYYQELGEHEKALADFNKAISIEPNAPYVYKARAVLNIELGEMEDAKADFEKSVELGKSDEAGQAYFSFAQQVLNYTGNKKEAAVYFKKCVEIGVKLGKQGDWPFSTAKDKLAEWKM